MAEAVNWKMRAQLLEQMLDELDCACIIRSTEASPGAPPLYQNAVAASDAAGVIPEGDSSDTSPSRCASDSLLIQVKQAYGSFDGVPVQFTVRQSISPVHNSSLRAFCDAAPGIWWITKPLPHAAAVAHEHASEHVSGDAAVSQPPRWPTATPSPTGIPGRRPEDSKPSESSELDAQAERHRHDDGLDYASGSGSERQGQRSDVCNSRTFESAGTECTSTPQAAGTGSTSASGGAGIGNPSRSHGDDSCAAAAATQSVDFSTQRRPHEAVEFHNAESKRYFGVHEPESLPNLLELIHPEDRLVYRTVWPRKRALGQPFVCYFRLRGASGHYAWHVARATPLARGPGGQALRWLDMFNEVEERLQTEARVAAERNMLRTVIDQMPIGVSQPDFATSTWTSEMQARGNCGSRLHLRLRPCWYTVARDHDDSR